MAPLFGKQPAPGNGNSQGNGVSNAFNGVLVVNTGAVAMSTGTQQVALQQIANYQGLPESRMTLQVTTVDTTGGSSAPVGVTGVSTALYELQLYGKSGALLYDGKGQDNDFINDAHMLNPYGYYAAEVTPTESATSTPYTNTFTQLLALSIDPSEFPLTPVVTINTQASRAGTLSSMTSTVQVQIWMDFETHSYVKCKLRSYNATGVTTGIYPIQAQLDKSVNVIAHAYYFASDSNLAATNSINFSNNGVQLINQMVKGAFIAKENSIYPSNAHITGLFPLNVAYTNPFNSNFSTVLQFNVATAPTIGGVSNVIKVKLLEAY